MRAVMLLAQLNEADLAVDSAVARQAEIAEALKEPLPLRAARADLKAASAEVARWEAEQNDRELVQKDATGKLQLAESRLYGGKVRVAKELQDLESDVAQLRRQLAATEDTLLEALVAVEAAREAESQRRELVERLAAEFATQSARLRAEGAQLQVKLPQLQARQRSARSAVPPALLPLYDSLRSRKGGKAVVQLDGDECSACMVAIPPTRLEAAREGSELVYCENCGRVVWGE